MKSTLILAAFLALVACKSASIPDEAEKQCREQHRLIVGTAEYNDCVAKLSETEAQLESAK